LLLWHCSPVARVQGQLAATALGAVGGLMLGSSIGRSLDDVDRLNQREAAHRALESQPSNVSTTWRNPDSGNSGVVTPTRTYQRGDGLYCREFTQVITVGGKKEQAFGTACRQPDGTWKVTE
jgi:surface antigen